MMKFVSPILTTALLLSLPIGLHAAETFKAVSYNIRYASVKDGPDNWLHRADTVAATIAQHDIAGLQEVTYKQLVDLKETLKEFEVYSIGREDGKQAGEHTSIFYRRDRFEKLDQGTFWLSENPTEVGSKSWDAAIMRICSWVVLRDQLTDRKLLFANTHFDHRGRKAREESGKLIQKMITERANALPVVLVGDFNCLPDSEPYQAIIAAADVPFVDARFVSAKPPGGPNSTWCGFKKIAPGRIIDHAFVAGPIEVESLTVLNPKTDQDRFGSDHLPVQVVVALTSE